MQRNDVERYRHKLWLVGISNVAKRKFATAP